MAILMHGHHAGSLFTVGRELGERAEQIKREKPAAEQALRLALIQDVTALLPQTLLPQDKAWAAFDKARAAFDKAWAAYVVSFDTEAFHREHCHPNCPWDGNTIFAKGTSIEVLEG